MTPAPTGQSPTSRRKFCRHCGSLSVLKKIHGSLDTLERTFLEIVQDVLNACQQQLYDWWRSFQKNANNVVRDEIASRHASKTLSAFERSDHRLQAWLKDALERGGAAIYSKPNTEDPRNTREQLGSKYVLKTMASHLAGTIGSVTAENENTYPMGALALAAAAVQRTFEWYLRDQPKGIKQTNFSLNNAGELTGFWQDNAIADLLEKPHQFKRILQRALKLVDAPAVVVKLSQSKVTATALYIRKRSSSPGIDMSSTYK
ncbi:hypothetical protein BN946_scf184779.g8 [Trametes cinnabarina]|uniref:Uncharacterized protein n=1 Tax=Pycnoporus cinnabarinus TaxID=5643 RepID=A0A060SEH8_PYCCI|nr:hypothetical protein BN946_scf184779.g8 [Trametes cinnabarina]